MDALYLKRSYTPPKPRMHLMMLGLRDDVGIMEIVGVPRESWINRREVVAVDWTDLREILRSWLILLEACWKLVGDLLELLTHATTTAGDPELAKVCACSIVGFAQQ